jgi:hypothetical protein
MLAAEIAEAPSKVQKNFSGVGIARGDGTTRARIAAIERYFAEVEADYAALIFSKELIFPESGDGIDFERGAKAQARFLDR